MLLKRAFRDFFGLIFPQSCVVCGRNLFSGENVFCTFCINEIPKTGFHLKKENPVAGLFYSNPKIAQASAFFRYQKGGLFQEVIHKLKYRNMPEIGVELGRLYGADLAGTDFSRVHILVPVPLHAKRLNHRGYNQSEKIAEGLSEILNIEIDTQSIVRNTNTKTQTKKSLDERRQNVNSVFTIKNPDALKNKHIMLVDDIITTGSTILSLADEIAKIEGTQISIISLGVAMN